MNENITPFTANQSHQQNEGETMHKTEDESVRDLATELKGQGLSAAEVANKINEAGHRRPRNGDAYNKLDIYRLMRDKVSKRGRPAKNPIPKPPKVITFIPENSKPQNIIALIGNVEQVRALIEGMVSNG